MDIGIRAVLADRVGTITSFIFLGGLTFMFTNVY